jgi:hypothetical protein
MHSQFIPLSLVGALIFAMPLHAADDSQTPQNRLKSAADLTSLDGKDLRPWHWKLDISVFDKDGKNPKAGSLEMWFSDGNLRSVASLGSRQITTLRLGDKLYRTAGDEKDLSGVRLVEMQALRPIPDDVAQSTAVQLVPESAGALKLDCLLPAVAQPAAKAAPSTIEDAVPKPLNDAPPTAPSVTFCFAQGSPEMLVTHAPGNFSILRPRVGMFESHQVPVELQVFSGTVMLLDAKTTKLEGGPFDPSLFQTQPGMGPGNGPLELPAADLRGLILSKALPVYPAEAKQHHVAGVVVFDATIGRDGRVVTLKPMPQSNAALIGSAKDAVSQWVFRPYRINDLPVEVKTELTVVYGAGGPAAAPGASDDEPPTRGRR